MLLLTLFSAAVDDNCSALSSKVQY